MSVKHGEADHKREFCFSHSVLVFAVVFFAYFFSVCFCVWHFRFLDNDGCLDEATVPVQTTIVCTSMYYPFVIILMFMQHFQYNIGRCFQKLSFYTIHAQQSTKNDAHSTSKTRETDRFPRNSLIYSRSANKIGRFSERFDCCRHERGAHELFARRSLGSDFARCFCFIIHI
jgi:hypothetical protein